MSRESWVADHAAWRGKVIAVTQAQLSDATGAGYRSADFPPSDPLFVLVTDAPLQSQDVVVRNNGRRSTYWNATALPRQLAVGEYVSQVEGPEYYGTGSAWHAVAAHPLCLLLNALGRAATAEFRAVLAGSVPHAGDWLEERGGDRGWAMLFRRRVEAYAAARRDPDEDEDEDDYVPW